MIVGAIGMLWQPAPPSGGAREWSGSSIPQQADDPPIWGIETSGNLMRAPGNANWISCDSSGEFSVGDSDSASGAYHFKVLSGQEQTIYPALNLTTFTTDGLTYNALTKGFSTSTGSLIILPTVLPPLLAAQCGYNASTITASGTMVRVGSEYVCLGPYYTTVSGTMYYGDWISLG